jgi:hypothetical protein
MGNKTSGVDFAPSASSTQPSENGRVEYRLGAPASAGLDKAFVINAAGIMQVLACLTHLMSVYAEDSGKVRVYAKLVEEKLQALGELMRPMLWSPA